MLMLNNNNNNNNNNNKIEYIFIHRFKRTLKLTTAYKVEKLFKRKKTNNTNY